MSQPAIFFSSRVLFLQKVRTVLIFQKAQRVHSCRPFSLRWHGVFDDVDRSPAQGTAMTKTMTKAVTQEESREPVKKTPADHVTDTLAQLKEMRHYSKTNVEHLTAVWLLFDGELSKLKRVDKIEDLMNRQSQLHEALEAVITDLEEALQKLQPAPG
jgi:hypothetical protein